MDKKCMPNFEIANGMLKNCTAETVTAVIPTEVTTILEAAFIDCSRMGSAYIPATVTKIEAGAFLGCEALRSVQVDRDNPMYCDMDGVLYSKDKTVLLCYPAGRTDTEFTVPDGVATIADSAFACCKNLRSVTIPGSVSAIENYAFLRCENLKNVTISGGKVAIGEGAFEQCRKLQNDYLKNQLNMI